MAGNRRENKHSLDEPDCAPGHPILYFFLKLKGVEFNAQTEAVLYVMPVCVISLLSK